MGENLVVPDEVLQAIEAISVLIGFPPPLSPIPVNPCVQDGKYSRTAEPKVSKPVLFVQGAQAPDNPFTQRVTTGPALRASPVEGHYGPSGDALDILAVLQRHVTFAPTDYSIAHVAALSGATRDTYSSRDEAGVETEK